MNRKVAGEGGYGCVLKPSIHCLTQPSSGLNYEGFNYDGYVSKIMKTKNANTELREFEIIGALDPTNEYHLGKPILCRPKLDDPNVKRDIDKCKRIKVTDINADPNNYSLLVLKDGGPDLKSLCGNHLTKYLKTFKVKKTDQFWLEVHHLIRGLQFFRESGMVHYDIKPQNILFDLKNGSMKYIDFGLMKSKAEIIENSKNNRNNSAIFHWSYPLDCGFMNKDKFDQYKISKHKKLIQMELTAMIVGDSRINKYELPVRKPQAFKILFTYLNPENVVPDNETQIGYINSFFSGFNLLLSEHSYNEILDRFTDSIDIFGLGFTLQYMANCFKRQHALSLEDYTRLSAFFQKMYDFNPKTRVIDIDELLNEYENILLQMGVLIRLNKSFERHVLIKENQQSIITKKSSKKAEHLSVELQDYAIQDPIIEVERISKTKSCPEEKELNPFTKRCINKCKSGFSRNSKFQCRKNKTKKHVLSKSKSRSKSRSRSNR
jgi:serine/threonine protein kinase